MGRLGCWSDLHWCLLTQWPEQPCFCASALPISSLVLTHLTNISFLTSQILILPTWTLTTQIQDLARFRQIFTWLPQHLLSYCILPAKWIWKHGNPCYSNSDSPCGNQIQEMFVFSAAQGLQWAYSTPRPAQHLLPNEGNKWHINKQVATQDGIR